MLEERDKALVEEELKRELERKNVLKYSKDIRKQLEERELIRAKEVERIEEEAIAMKKALDIIEKVRKRRSFYLQGTGGIRHMGTKRCILGG